MPNATGRLQCYACSRSTCDFCVQEDDTARCPACQSDFVEMFDEESALVSQPTAPPEQVQQQQQQQNNFDRGQAIPGMVTMEQTFAMPNGTMLSLHVQHFSVPTSLLTAGTDLSLEILGTDRASFGFPLGDLVGSSAHSMDTLLNQLLLAHQPALLPTAQDVLNKLPRRRVSPEQPSSNNTFGVTDATVASMATAASNTDSKAGLEGPDCGDEAPFASCRPNEACTVCHDAMSCGEVVVELPCSHCFHEGCIMPWLTSNSTCPVCRHRLGTEQRPGGAATASSDGAGAPELAAPSGQLTAEAGAHASRRPYTHLVSQMPGSPSSGGDGTSVRTQPPIIVRMHAPSETAVEAMFSQNDMRAALESVGASMRHSHTLTSPMPIVPSTNNSMDSQPLSQLQPLSPRQPVRLAQDSSGVHQSSANFFERHSSLHADHAHDTGLPELAEAGDFANNEHNSSQCPSSSGGRATAATAAHTTLAPPLFTLRPSAAATAAAEARASQGVGQAATAQASTTARPSGFIQERTAGARLAGAVQAPGRHWTPEELHRFEQSVDLAASLADSLLTDMQQQAAAAAERTDGVQTQRGRRGGSSNSAAAAAASNAPTAGYAMLDPVAPADTHQTQRHSHPVVTALGVVTAPLRWAVRGVSGLLRGG